MRTSLKILLLAAGIALAAAEARPARSADDKVPEGFTSLFDGKDLTGWKSTGKMDQWGAEPGLIVCKGGGGGWLLTEKDYGNFELRCEYRWSAPGGNSGVALRTPFKGDPAYVGMEIQLIDDEGYEKVHKYKLQDWQKTGAIYNVQPPKLQNNKPIGEWNAIRIVANGRKITVELNGKELVNADLDDYKDKYEKHPGIKPEQVKGRVGFQSHDGRVEFKNVFIKELQ